MKVHPRFDPVNDERRLDKGNALLARARGVEPTGAAAIYLGCSLKDLETLEAMPQGAGDFAYLLENVLQERTLDFYRNANPASRVLTRGISLADFRPTTLVGVGDFPSLQRVAEGAVIQAGAIDDSGETLILARFGRILGLSDIAIQNDDIGALNNLAELAAIAAIECENRLLFAVLLSGAGANGPTLRDGQPLFGAAHANLMPAAALTATSLGLAIGALRKQRSIDSALLNLEPALVLVGPDTEVAARTALRTVYLDSASAPTVVVDASITDASFYVLAAPALRPALVRGYRGRDDGPLVVARTGFSFDGIEFKVMYDTAIGACDWRPIVRVPSP